MANSFEQLQVARKHDAAQLAIIIRLGRLPLWMTCTAPLPQNTAFDKELLLLMFCRALVCRAPTQHPPPLPSRARRRPAQTRPPIFANLNSSDSPCFNTSIPPAPLPCRHLLFHPLAPPLPQTPLTRVLRCPRCLLPSPTTFHPPPPQSPVAFPPSCVAS